MPSSQLAETPLAPQDAHALLHQLQLKDGEIHSMRGLWRATIQDGDGVQVLRYAISFIRPDTFRVEALPTAAAYTLQLLVVHGGEALFLDTGEKRAYRSSKPEELLQRMLHLSLQVEALEALLVARISGAILEQAIRGEQFEIKRNEVSGEYRVVLGATTYLINGADLLLNSAEFRRSSDDTVAGRFEYGARTSIGGVLVPVQVKIILPDEELSFELKLVSGTINKSFSISMPEVPSDYTTKYGR